MNDKAEFQLLLVEDDPSLGETLKERLEKETYLVTWAKTFKEAEAAMQANKFSLVLLDVSLPDGSGFDLGRKLKENSTVPFLFMTALNTAENRLSGYEMGAEEFIPKPFHLKELLLRVKHVLKSHPPQNSVLHLADRKLDLQSRSVTLNSGAQEFLQERDFQLLKLLLDRTPAAVSRDEILNEIWGEDKFPSHRTVDNAIVRLRQALGDSGSVMIRSVRGVGYQWVGMGVALGIALGIAQTNEEK